MPAKDRYHDTVVRALVKAGWSIVDEQVKVEIARRRLWIDIHAQQSDLQLAILVEVKGFENSPSPIEELAKAVGQYLIYQTALSAVDIKFPLYLAVPQSAYQGILSEPIGQSIVKQIDMRLLIFDPIQEEIIQWIP